MTQFHKNGEAELAKGAEESNCTFVLSGMSRLKVKKIRSFAKNANIIYQLFIHGDFNWIKKQISEAQEINSIAICITCDSPVRSINYKNLNNNYDARKLVLIIGILNQMKNIVQNLLGKISKG